MGRMENISACFASLINFLRTLYKRPACYFDEDMLTISCFYVVQRAEMQNTCAFVATLKPFAAMSLLKITLLLLPPVGDY